MTQIIRPDVLTGSPSYESEPLPIAQSFIDKVNEVGSTETDDVLLQTLEASILAIASLELRLTSLVNAIGAVELQKPNLFLGTVRGDDAPQ
ncbi:hypothetical protein HCX50_17150 [Microbacterium oxydans]|uniref:hypothetical protein n=1 Tax=Microbacterium sp. B19(2022) TaxID=2914045 RepID=UPI001431FEDD|nr:hypothetical protein [Microbacterium sp. B19(2022)]NJI61156.1 hypothetical protein [Microbacterium sp. B19(2022)]